MKILKNNEGKTEFSKCWLAVCVIFTIVFTSASYVLAIFDKNPVTELSQTIIETMWGASGVSFIGYALQNSARAFAFWKLTKSNETEVENYGLGNDYPDNSDMYSGSSDNNIPYYEPEEAHNRVAKVRRIDGKKRAR